MYLPNDDLRLLKIISDHIHVSKCVSATCAISGTSGSNLSIEISPPEMLQMLRNLGSYVIHS